MKFFFSLDFELALILELGLWADLNCWKTSSY
jgi:hypothetical protein